MRKIFKKLTHALLATINIRLSRRLNGKKLSIPLLKGMKVGISGEKWMSGLLKALFAYTEGAFYDIGANRGQTLIKVRSIDTHRSYIGFEPNPSCLFYLQQLIACNNWTNTTLIPAGIHTDDGLWILSGDNDTDGGATVIEECKKPSATVTKLVPLFSYTTIRRNLPKQTVAIIKIDVEGAELEVMSSLSDLINEQRPILIMEIWQSDANACKKQRTEKLVNLLGSMQYKSYGLVTHKSRGTYLGLSETALGHAKLDNYVLLPREKEQSILKTLTTDNE